MPWYPEAVRRPINRNYTKRKITVVRALLHTDAGNAASLYGWWMHPENKGASSHFHVAKSGTVEQYVDTDYMTWTSGDGSDDSTGIETQGYGNEPWTTAQVRSLVKLLAWLCSEHPIPVRQMASSASSEKGIGWHRLGVNGNFPSGILAGRLQRGGGEVWSKATGKQCPGDDRIRQIPGIIAQVKSGGTPAPTPEPAPSTGGYTGSSVVEYLNHSGKDSSYAARAALASQYGITPYTGTAEQNARLLASLRAAAAAPAPPVVTVTRPSQTTTTEGELTMSEAAKILEAVAKIPAATLSQHVNVVRSGKPATRSAATLLGSHDAALGRIVAEQAAQREIIGQLAKGTGVTIDYGKVEDAARSGAAAAIIDAQEG